MSHWRKVGFNTNGKHCHRRGSFMKSATVTSLRNATKLLSVIIVLECRVIHLPNWLSPFGETGFAGIHTHYSEVTQSWNPNSLSSSTLFNIEKQFFTDRLSVLHTDFDMPTDCDIGGHERLIVLKASPISSVLMGNWHCYLWWQIRCGTDAQPVIL